MNEIIKMNKQDRLNYIFSNRFDWLSGAILSDIRTLIIGGQTLKNKNSRILGGRYGAGNISIPILLCTAIELASALYTGNTKYNMGKKAGSPSYDATVNVEKFIEMYFPLHYKKLPRFLWDGLRNGIDHTFIPKSMRYHANKYQIMLYVEDKTKQSHVIRSKNTFEIKINSIQLYLILKQALEKYRSELVSEKDLQLNFIRAWKSLERYHTVKSNSPISKEIKYLSRQLRRFNQIDLSL